MKPIKDFMLVIVLAMVIAIGGFSAYRQLTTEPRIFVASQLTEHDGIGRVEIWGQMLGFATYNLYDKFQVFKAQGIKEVHIFIMSPGGAVVDAFGAVDAINKAKSEGMYIVTIARGMVASAAVPVFCAGSYRIAGANTQFMLHKPDREYVTDENDIELYDLTEHMYTRIVADNCDLTYQEVDKLCTDFTWFTAKEAMRYGMVDRIG